MSVKKAEVGLPAPALSLADLNKAREMRHDLQVFNVTDYGARADGQAKDTEAITRAIAACAQAGGGRVQFPEGTYLTGSIELRSEVELHLAAGATVLFSRDFDDYPLVVTNWEGEQTVRCRSPLWGENLYNVAITGQGAFDGQGEAWRPVKRMKRSPQQWEQLVASGGVVDEARGIWWPSAAAMKGEDLVRRLRQNGRANGRPLHVEEFRPAREYLRPNMVKLVECRNVRLDGPTFRNSPAWNVHLLMCEDVTMQNLTVQNPWYAQNGDGLDIESCRNVLVSDCLVDAGDDAICLKSGKDEEGRRRARPTENVTIRRCTVLHGHGGVVVGSEMSGGVRHVEVSDCEFRGTDVGLRFKTARGRGGIVEEISIRNVTMSDIGGAAISFNMYYGGKSWDEQENPEPVLEPVSEATPQFRHIHIENVTCQGAERAIEIVGLPEMPAQHIALEHVEIAAQHGALLREASHITLRDVRLRTKTAPAIECHNVTNLTLERVDGEAASELALANGRVSSGV